MKNQLNIRNFFIITIGLFLTTSSFAQTAKKSSLRLKANYVKVMDKEVYFNIKASARVNKKNVNVSNIELTIYNEVNDETILIGKTTTNMNGESKFIVEGYNKLQPDSLNTYTIKIAFKGDDSFKKASKSIQFKNADIKASMVIKDSVNYISATLIDSSNDTPIGNESLSVQVQRMFQPLQIEEFNITDDSGTILVPIEKGIPGIDGNIVIEVVLNENDDFGTVIAQVSAPIGTPIVDESTFDERKMWSPRNKTPIFLLVFPNLLIFGMWSLIIYLGINLFKIAKS